MPDIPVPAITPASSSRWSWDPEEERKRQEKWQKEQERLLQEKYKRDQEKLQEEWLKAQQEIVTSVGNQQQPGSLQVSSHSVSPHSPPSSLQPTPALWEEEERQRKVEQECQRQAEERRKREEEERELLRLQEERKRREMQEEEERKKREMQQEEERKRREVELRMQRMREEELRIREEEHRRQEEEREEERRQQEAAEQQRRQKVFGQQRWVKSQSSPQLDEDDKLQRGGVLLQPEGMVLTLLEEEMRTEHENRIQSQRAASELERRNYLRAMRYAEAERDAVTGSGASEKKSQQSLSHAELERQQILNEMKKKTPLLTDSSWIRQRTASAAINRENDMPSMRRGESLDNLDSYNSQRSSWTPRSSSFAPSYYRPYSGYSGNSSFYTGGSGARRPISSTLPSSYSMGSLQGGAGTHTAPWSRPSPSPSTPSPTTSPDPTSEAYHQRN
ncbi:hypothetical protein CHARACLAT_004825, partial [Characodon lateralis]|nr:hypothetical protein [Characodon lateralis]